MAPTSRLHLLPDRRHRLCDVGGRLRVEVRHRKAATDVDRLDGQLVLRTEHGNLRQQDINRSHVRLCIKNLRAQVRMYRRQAQTARTLQHGTHLRQGLECKAEFGGIMPRLNMMMRVGRNVRRDADLDGEGCSTCAGFGNQQRQFIQIIHHNRTNVGRQRLVELTRRLAVAVHVDMCRIDARMQRQGQLAPRHYVECKSLAMYQLRNRHIEQRFTGIVDDGITRPTRATGLRIGLTHVAERFFIKNIQWRVVCIGQRHHIMACDGQVSIGGDCRCHRPDMAECHTISPHLGILCLIIPHPPGACASRGVHGRWSDCVGYTSLANTAKAAS